MPVITIASKRIGRDKRRSVEIATGKALQKATNQPPLNGKENPMKPTIGRIVHYRLSGQDANAINARRKDAKDKLPWHHAIRSGAQVHVGNDVKEGDVYPLVITRMWGDSETSAFNGQLLLDGNDLFWVTSTAIGDGNRQCFWPPRD